MANPEQKTTESVRVVTLRPVYHDIDPKLPTPPLPIGTHMDVSADRAVFWENLGIVRRAGDTETLPTVRASSDLTVKAADIPPAPPMTPAPQQNGQPGTVSE
ncbi:hypothetical protein [Acetobacter aceti]|nr:hypothetical protein [Acetobacter aceti]